MYEKTQWVNGGPPGISAEKLNKIEQGIYEAHLKPGLRNVLINGDFRIWQRGEVWQYDQDRDDRYCADRFYTSGFAHHKSDDAPEGFSSSLEDEYNDGLVLYQRIEAENAVSLAGKSTLSFYYKSEHPGVIQISLKMPGDKDDYSTIDDVGGLVERNMVEGEWVREEVTFDLAENDIKNGLEVNIFFHPDEMGKFNTTGWQLEKGETATPFEHRPFGFELSLCQRYWCKTSSYNRYPWEQSGDNYGGNGRLYWTVFTDTSQTWQNAYQWQFPVEMRFSPNVNIYSFETGAEGKLNVRWSDVEEQGDIDGVAGAVSRNSVDIRPVDNADIGDPATGRTRVACHVTAEAEL